jgi:hypothetical protein
MRLYTVAADLLSSIKTAQLFADAVAVWWIRNIGISVKATLPLTVAF